MSEPDVGPVQREVVQLHGEGPDMRRRRLQWNLLVLSHLPRSGAHRCIHRVSTRPTRVPRRVPLVRSLFYFLFLERNVGMVMHAKQMIDNRNERETHRMKHT